MCDKEIEEFARDLCGLGRKSCTDCMRPIRCRAMDYAEIAYRRGYRKVKQGYWVRNEDHNAYESEHFCSVCLADGSYDVSNEKYCYNCGAKMDGERRTDNG